MLMKTGVILPNKRDNECIGDSEKSQQSMALVPVGLQNRLDIQKRMKKQQLAIMAQPEGTTLTDFDGFDQYTLSQLCGYNGVGVAPIEDTYDLNKADESRVQVVPLRQKKFVEHIESLLQQKNANNQLPAICDGKGSLPRSDKTVDIDRLYCSKDSVAQPR